MATWPTNFTVQGALRSSGNRFHPQNQVSDCHVRVSDDDLKYELHAVSNQGAGTKAQVFYSEVAVAGSITNGWSDPRTGEFPDSVIAPIAGTDNANGVDTPHVCVHDTMSSGGSLLALSEARPGERSTYPPLGGVTRGRASVIKVQTDHQRKPGATRTWCQNPGRTILRGRQEWNKPFLFTNGQGQQEASGGVLEPTGGFFDATLGPQGGIWFGFLGLNERFPGGPWEARIGRAKWITGATEAVIDPVTPVWTPPTGWTRREGFMPDWTLDPDGTTWHMCLIGNGGHVYNYRSTDKGLTWIGNEQNPILRVNAAGLPTRGEAFLAGPRLLLNPAGTQWLLFFDFRYAKPSGGNIGGDDGGLYVATATV